MGPGENLGDSRLAWLCLCLNLSLLGIVLPSNDYYKFVSKTLAFPYIL